MRYQMQLSTYGSKKSELDTKLQSQQNELDRELEKELSTADEEPRGFLGIGKGPSDADKIRAKYAPRQQKLDAAKAQAAVDLGAPPQMPPELSQTPAGPAPRATQQPPSGGSQQKAPPAASKSLSRAEAAQLATSVRRNPNTGEHAYLVGGKWYKESELK